MGSNVSSDTGADAREAHYKATIAIRRPLTIPSFPGLTLCGEFAYDRGTVLSGVVYKGKYYDHPDKLPH